ncbi:sugar transferase [Desulfobacter hydrogenophilus]|nr:sugar transferase [Desulfobacter hydrogenophilus]
MFVLRSTMLEKCFRRNSRRVKVRSLFVEKEMFFINKRHPNQTRAFINKHIKELPHEGWFLESDNGRPWALSYTKRFIDLFLALFLLFVSAPLLCLLAVLIKINSPGPVFFRQERTGYLGRRFQMIKLRTMVNGADKLKNGVMHLNQHGSDSPDFKATNDPRVTGLGSILRKFSLDEIPNLINVVKGEMRLVGPRPTSFNTDVYSPSDLRRLVVPPGITGYWQVMGRGDVDFCDRVLLDDYYIQNQSPLLDIKILFKTFFVVFNHKGAY